MITTIDFAILDFIRNHFTCPLLDTLVPLVTRLGDSGIIWILLTLILLFPKKTRRYGLAMAVALVLDLLLCNILIKPLVGRTRPFDLRDVALIIPKPTDYSFPSGHTAASFAAAGALTFMGARGRIPALILGTLIALSRLYLYVHYPSDVLGGLILGLICGFAGAFCVKHLPRREINSRK